MTHDSATNRSWPFAVVAAALFAVAHTQSPAYFSNQHHYYLHGFATAGYGHLNEDWLSNTKDPTPVYSWAVAAFYQSTGPITFHVIFFVLLGIYFDLIRRLIAALPGFPDRGPARILFLTMFIAAHAAILRVAAVRLAGVDFPWYLQAGLAAQYLLGPGLQPSAFGVLLVASLAAFIRGRPLLAALLAAAAAVIHATYLLPAGLIVLGYLVVLVRERRVRIAIVAGLLALAVVAPILVFSAATFLSGDAEQQREAQRIFARIRIPHHTQFARWFDWMAMAQIAVMLLGIVLVWRTRLFLVLLTPAIGSTILTVIQALTDSDSLALLFPWRFSAVLMPVSLAIVFARLATLAAGWLESGPILHWTCGLMVAALAIGGIAVMALGLGFYTNDAELPLLDYVRDHKERGDVYLLPVKFPTIKKETPAGQSKTFAPPVRTGQAGIPVDLQRFRLSTGAPIYVDFKAPPYAAAEVIAWHQRMANAERWYADRDWDKTGVWREVQAAGITHVVATTDKDLKCQALRLVYSDESYRVYWVAGGR